jgi:hypothetical protein
MIDGIESMDALDNAVSEPSEMTFDKWKQKTLSKLRRALLSKHLNDKDQQLIQTKDPPSLNMVYLGDSLAPAESSSILSSILSLQETSRRNSTATALPPLKIRKLKHNALVKRQLRDAGFDDALGRETPRCLRGGAATADVTIEELRQELYLAQESLWQLGAMVDTNIAWVQTNCDTTAVTAKISEQGRSKCHAIAIGKLVSAVDSYLTSTKVWAVLRWKSVARQAVLLLTASAFSKAKGLHTLSVVFSSAYRRQYKRALQPWQELCREKRQLERNHASIQIQRVARGRLGRLRVARLAQEHADATKKKILQLVM